MTEILVTGGAGFIGSHIVEEALKKGIKVTVFDNFSSGKLSNLDHLDQSNLSVLEGDIRNKDAIKALFESQSFSAVFHEAAIASVQDSIRQPEYTYAVNVLGARNIFQAAAEHNVPKVVFASSAAVYGNDPRLPKREGMIPHPASPYGEHKLANEEDAKFWSQKSNTSFTALRYFNVFGERQDPSSEYSGVISIFMNQFKKKSGITVYGDGEHTRDFIYVKDVVLGNLLAMDHRHPFNVFNLGTGVQSSLNQLIKAIESGFGFDVDVTYALPREGDIVHSVASIEEIIFQLKFSPQFSFSDGIVRLIASL
jgi:UDP-glucose 4-epimerase